MKKAIVWAAPSAEELKARGAVSEPEAAPAKKPAAKKAAPAKKPAAKKAAPAKKPEAVASEEE